MLNSLKGLKEGKELRSLIYESYGDGNNADPDMQAMVNNNIRKGSILLNKDYKRFDVIRK